MNEIIETLSKMDSSDINKLIALEIFKKVNSYSDTQKLTEAYLYILEGLKTNSAPER